MSDEQISSTLPQKRLRPAGIDTVLRDFFQSEMPHPWPKAPVSTPQTVVASREVYWWQQSSRYLALTAAVALLVVGYCFLSGFFPTPSKQSSFEIQPAAENIASKPRVIRSNPEPMDPMNPMNMP